MWRAPTMLTGLSTAVLQAEASSVAEPTALASGVRLSPESGGIGATLA
jgi:hypothetical protein